MMTKIEIQARIKELRDELESRHKYGVVKIAKEDGTPIEVQVLQDEMFNLIYRLSKFD